MFNGKKPRFQYQNDYIDSINVFDNGDFIIFGGLSGRFSTLYDGKTFEPKLNLNIPSLCGFCNLLNDEFAIRSEFSHFEIYKFNSDRTSYTLIQKISTKEGGSSKNLGQLSNGDIYVVRIYVGYSNLYIYRKSESNPKYEPYGGNFLYHLEGIEDLINLNEKEVLGYKIDHGDDCLRIKIFNSEDYKVKRQNEIKFNHEGKKRLYISLPVYKVKNKLITAGAKNFYIIGLDNLELETTIQFDKYIKRILIRPKGNIFLIYKSNDYIQKEGEWFYKQYINNIKIDFETNDLIQSKEEDITEYCGNNKELFEVYNYVNNGIITMISKTNLYIYKNFDD